MLRAAERQGTTPDRISFIDALRWLLCAAAPGQDVAALVTALAAGLLFRVLRRPGAPWGPSPRSRTARSARRRGAAVGVGAVGARPGRRPGAPRRRKPADPIPVYSV